MIESNIQAWTERERGYVRKAVELAGNQNPLFNIYPLVELIRSADALGFDVVKREDGKCQLQPREPISAEGSR